LGLALKAGKSSPVVASILKSICDMHAWELRFVWLRITARTNRGVNCPKEQALYRRSFPMECVILKRGFSARGLINAGLPHFIQETCSVWNFGTEILSDGLTHVGEGFANAQVRTRIASW
jgi:hypothetical protein